MAARYTSFAAFYPYYLTQHADRVCRRTHFIGSTGALAALALYFASGNGWWIAAALVLGYGGGVDRACLLRKKPPGLVRPALVFVSCRLGDGLADVDGQAELVG